MGRRGKPRAIGRKGAQRRVRPLHQFRRSPKGLTLYFCALTSRALIPTRAVSSQGCRSIVYVY